MDIKNIAIISLVALLLSISLLYFFSSSGYKKDLRRINGDIKKMELKRDSLDAENDRLKKEVSEQLKNIAIYQAKIDSVEKLISNKDREISKLKSSAIAYKKEYDKARAAIENLKNNPIKRVGDGLLNSLKEKTK